MALGLRALKQLKEHVRVDYPDEDVRLERLLTVAEETVVAMTGRPKEDLVDSFGRYPAPLYQAMIIYAGHLFDEPGAMVSANLKPNPFGINTLVKPFIKLTD